MHTQVEEPLGGSRGLVFSEGKGDPDVSQCDAAWVPVLTYAQEGPTPGAHSVLTMDVAQHGYVASTQLLPPNYMQWIARSYNYAVVMRNSRRSHPFLVKGSTLPPSPLSLRLTPLPSPLSCSLDLVLVCACLAQHRREGSKASPRYRLPDLILSHLRSPQSPELAGILSLRGTQMAQVHRSKKTDHGYVTFFSILSLRGTQMAQVRRPASTDRRKRIIECVTFSGVCCIIMSP